jgi:hypothetical protein
VISDPDVAPARLFSLSGRQTGLIGILTVLAFAAAYDLRYHGIESSQAALACQAGTATWFCGTIKLATALFRHSVFGWSALAAALLHLIHPSLVLFTFALVAAAFGLILYNAGLCGLAAALLMLSFARRVSETI